MKVDICLPVYNEDLIFNDNASQLLTFLRNSDLKVDWRVIFIVNGSSLDFQRMVQEFVDQNAIDTSVFFVKKAGKGRAIKTYFDFSQADVLAYMDIDLAVDLNNLFSLLAPVLSGELDLCLGSRMLASSRVKRSYLRGISSQAYIAVSRLLLKHDVSDLQCGFKAIDAKSWRQLSPKIQNNDFFFDTELIYFARKVNLKIKEIPVDWSENRYHLRCSKTNLWRDSVLFMWEIWKLWRRRQ
jgi:glycosyltransferase involved in cell wall biosynthesis